MKTLFKVEKFDNFDAFIKIMSQIFSVFGHFNVPGDAHSEYLKNANGERKTGTNLAQSRRKSQIENKRKASRETCCNEEI